MPWYKGPTLNEVIEKIPVPRRPFDLPLRMPINECFKISGIGTVAVGRVETGVMKVGMNIAFCPGEIVCECKSIEMHKQSVQEARPGDNIGFNVRGINYKDVKRGMVASDANNKPASEVSEFLAQIVVLNHSTQIAVGYRPILFCHSNITACKISAIYDRVDKKTGKIIEKEPKYIKNGDSALVRFIPTKPLCVETYKEFPPLGRFIIRDANAIVAIGIIKEITKKVETKK